MFYNPKTSHVNIIYLFYYFSLLYKFWGLQISSKSSKKTFILIMNALGKTTFIPHPDFPKVLFSFPKTSSASLKTSSASFWKPAHLVWKPARPVFVLFTFFLPVYCVNQKQCAAFWKTSSTCFGTGSAGFDFGPPTSSASHLTEKHSGRNRLNRF
jgi:hypothetical protein